MAAFLVAAPTTIAYLVTVALRFTQLCIDFESSGAGEAVFQEFMLMDRSVTCVKLFIIAYRQVHAEGAGLLAFSCLLGLWIYLCIIVIHLYMKHRSHARAWISGMAILVAAGALMLAMKIPKQVYAWHQTAVDAILVFFVYLDAILIARNKMSEQGDNDNLLRELIMVAVETLVNYCLFADYLVKKNSPWDAEHVLHLVGTCLAVLIGVGQIGWIAYKAYTHGVFAWGEKQEAGDGMHGGDVEQQRVKEGAEVEEGVRKTPAVFTREVETAAVAANGDGR
ncbi:hypothetical protein ZWY2020_050444 [Hordeum vulgare]|nr:hypothetical protein ZWY2020_050444 [Hordeum vulgare]